MNTVSITTLGDAQHDIGPNTHVWLSAGQTVTINRDDTARYRDVLRVRVNDNNGRICVVYHVVNVHAARVDVSMDVGCRHGGTIELRDVDVSILVDDVGDPMVSISRDDVPGLDVDDVIAHRVVIRKHDGA